MLAILLAIVSCMSHSQVKGGGVTIIRSDDRTLVFEYKPLYKPDQIVRSGNIDMVRYDFVGARSEDRRENVGGPDILYEAIPIGFPSPEGATVQVLAGDYEDVPNVTLLPVPATRLQNDIVEVAGYTIAADKYAVPEFIPSPAVGLIGPNRTRSMWVGSLKVYPVQYNGSTRTMRKYSRMVVEVTFGSTTLPRVQNNDDKIFDGVLVNYAVARNWKFSGRTSLARPTVASSVLATGDWYRLTIDEEGVYIINAAYLRAAGINLSGLDPRTIKIYGNGGKEVPESIIAPRDTDLVENAIYVVGEDDGQFNDNDYLLFYARSLRNWNYNTSTHLLEHRIHHYAEHNYYWLTFGGANGRRMQIQPSLTDNPVASPAKFLDMVVVEEENVNLLNSGKDWVGRSYTPGESYTYVNNLPGLVPGDVITYQFRLVARSNVLPLFTVKEDGTQGGTTQLGTYTLGSVVYNSDYGYATQAVYRATGTSDLSNNTSRLNFTFTSSSISATGWNDWIRIEYPRRLEAVSGSYLRFRSPDDLNGVAEYTLGQFSSAPVILNVTQPQNVRRITGVVGAYTFRAQEVAGAVSEYCAASPASFKQPAGIARMANQDLHGGISGADFIIITSPEFMGAANRMKAYREQPQHGNLRTVVVDVNQIYNEFSGGLTDVTAIRDFLKLAYDTWNPSPAYVMFMGQGSYDYKGRRGSRSSYVPAWQSDESLDWVYSYSTDDFFVQLGGGTGTYMATGRVNARATSEADAFVTKLISYENESVRDSWKMRTLFVGDDDFTTDPNQPSDGAIHSIQAEELATYHTPNEFEKKKIYIAEYPTVYTAQGRRKPGAYQDIIDRINEGVLLVNFTGHGNPTVWTHESIFTVQTSIPQLFNANKLAVFFVATCNFSEWDDANRYSGSELLINRVEGGAIGVVSATRKSFSGDNARLNWGVFDNMFTRDMVTGRLSVAGPAWGLYRYKATNRNDTNDQKYFLLGDPTMNLQYPSGYVSIDSINHQPIDGPPVQLRALSRVSVQGTVRTASNDVDSTVSGRLLLTTNDASRTILIPNFYNFSYVASGGAIFHGQNSIRNGRFNATFVVPKDILYADSTNNGRLVLYAVDSLGAGDGAGFTQNVRVGGTDAGVVDTIGPSMTMYIGSRSFRPGDVVGESPLLLIDLTDSSGINTSASGIGHGIDIWLNGSTQSTSITDSYTSQLDNYQKGTVQYTLKNLPEGKNTLRVRAWDTYNNASTAETFFEVASTDQLRISDVFNYPNPFASGTSFTFKQNLLSPLNVTVKIYTPAGRLIQSIDAVTGTESFVTIPWDGRDRDGDILANGVYLYKLIVRTVDGRFGSEVLGKLAVLK